MSAFRSPVVLVAIVLWILNDHLLKGLYPGLVTGKLSDACGLVVTPLLLILLAFWLAPSLEHRRAARSVVVAIAVTAVALPFALAKTWDPANALYCHAFEVIRTPLRLVFGALHGITWTERITLVKDPTDLFVLPFALYAVRQVRSSPRRSARLAKVAPS